MAKNPEGNQFQQKIRRLENEVKYSKETQSTLKARHASLPPPEIEETEQEKLVWQLVQLEHKHSKMVEERRTQKKQQ